MEKLGRRMFVEKYTSDVDIPGSIPLHSRSHLGIISINYEEVQLWLCTSQYSLSMSGPTIQIYLFIWNYVPVLYCAYVDDFIKLHERLYSRRSLKSPIHDWLVVELFFHDKTVACLRCSNRRLVADRKLDRRPISQLIRRFGKESCM